MSANVHPSEAMNSWVPAHVLAVHPDTWEVDVQLRYSAGGRVPRCRVLGHWLPEVHREGRESLVLVGWTDAYLNGPVAIPAHSFVMPKPEYADHVYWSEHFGWRIKISQPGRNPNAPTAPKTGELEIRTTNTPAGPLRIRIQEETGVIRLDTPDTHIVMRQDAKSIQIICTETVSVQCKDAEVTASNDITATAGGNLTATAGGNLTATAGADAHVQSGGATTIQSAAPATVSAPVIVLSGTVVVP